MKDAPEVEVSRADRLTAKLRKIFPIYNYIGLSVVELGNPLRCRVPISAANGNHFDVMHAGVLFSLAEAAAGLSVTQHREFGAMLIIAEKIVVEYRRPARTDITATVTLGDEFFERLRSGLAADPKYRFDILVELSNDAGEVVMTATCGFQLRPPRPEA